MRKIFVLDTNILLTNPNSIFQFEEHEIVLPITVIEEIDNFKSKQSETGRNAREISRILDRLRTRGTLSQGIPLFEDRDDSGMIRVHLNQTASILPEHLVQNADNKILSVALNLQEQTTDKEVILVSKDANLRIKADAFGLKAENYEADRVDVSRLYTGVSTLQVDKDVINNLYAKREAEFEKDGLIANQYLILEDENDSNQVVYGAYNAAEKKVRMVENNPDGVWGIFPRNIQQNFALDALLNDDIKLLTLSGGAGTGKTLLAVAAGLAKTTDEDKYHKLLVSRPIFPLGRDVGFLPGDLDEKLNPWMQPIFDNLELLLGGGVQSKKKGTSRGYEELINQGILAVEPLTYIRGRSLPNQFFIVDEAQNLTPHEIKTILTRAGDDTKVVLTGDPYQIDHPYLDAENNGLTYVIERFKNCDIAAHVTLAKGERSGLASLAAKLL